MLVPGVRNISREPMQAIWCAFRQYSLARHRDVELRRNDYAKSFENATRFLILHSFWSFVVVSTTMPSCFSL
jgi:hypothetical protein